MRYHPCLNHVYMVWYTTPTPYLWNGVQNRVSGTSQDDVSCVSDARFEVFKVVLRGEVLNTTLWRGGDTHERCCTYQRVIT